MQWSYRTRRYISAGESIKSNEPELTDQFRAYVRVYCGPPFQRPAEEGLLHVPVAPGGRPDPVRRVGGVHLARVLRAPRALRGRRRQPSFPEGVRSIRRPRQWWWILEERKKLLDKVDGYGRKSVPVIDKCPVGGIRGFALFDQAGRLFSWFQVLHKKL